MCEVREVVSLRDRDHMKKGLSLEDLPYNGGKEPGK